MTVELPRHNEFFQVSLGRFQAKGYFYIRRLYRENRKTEKANRSKLRKSTECNWISDITISYPKLVEILEVDLENIYFISSCFCNYRSLCIRRRSGTCCWCECIRRLGQVHHEYGMEQQLLLVGSHRSGSVSYRPDRSPPTACKLEFLIPCVSWVRPKDLSENFRRAGFSPLINRLNNFLMEGFFEQTAAPLAGFIDRFCIGAE